MRNECAMSYLGIHELSSTSSMNQNHNANEPHICGHRERGVVTSHAQDDAIEPRDSMRACCLKVRQGSTIFGEQSKLDVSSWQRSARGKPEGHRSCKKACGHENDETWEKRKR